MNMRFLRIFVFFLAFTSSFLVSEVLLPSKKTLAAEVNTEEACISADGECISGTTRGDCGTKKKLGRCDVLNERICCSKSEDGVIGTAACEADSKQKCSIGADCGSYRSKVGECDKNSLGVTQSCCREVDTSTTGSGDSASASLTYKTLENLPGFENESTDFANYIKNLYLLAIWIVGICALFMLTLGGFLYLSSAGNTSLIGSAKKTITGALVGLVIALTTWLILNTINPDLTTVSLSSLSLSSSSTGSSSTGSGSSSVASGNADKSGCEALSNNAVPSQCGLASAELVKVLSCMRKKGVTVAISSISASNVNSDQSAASACCGDSRPSSCKHSKVTCHYGCTFGTKGLSYAADLATRNLTKNELCNIASIAQSAECGGGNVWGPMTECGIKYEDGHGSIIDGRHGGDGAHLHVSVSGCQH